MPDSYCDDNEGIAGLVCTWILLFIAILTVSLRIYVRSGVNRKIGWDDYTAVAGLVSTPSCLRSAQACVIATSDSRNITGLYQLSSRSSAS